jgi:hypothetical protein
MRLRISFTADVLIEGDTINDIRRQWERMELFSNEAKDADVCFLSIDYVEDADTCVELDKEFYDAKSSSVVELP